MTSSNVTPRFSDLQLPLGKGEWGDSHHLKTRPLPNTSLKSHVHKKDTSQSVARICGGGRRSPCQSRSVLPDEGSWQWGGRGGGAQTRHLAVTPRPSCCCPESKPWRPGRAGPAPWGCPASPSRSPCSGTSWWWMLVRKHNNSRTFDSWHLTSQPHNLLTA